MTTLLYDHENKQIAYDSRICEDNKICTDSFDKHFVTEQGDYFLSGAVCYFEDFINAHEGEHSEPIDPVSVGGLFVDKEGEVYLIESDMTREDMLLVFRTKLTWSEGVGSGGQLALSALDLGLSAEQAVEYAKTRDSKTGGEVNTFDF